MEEQCSPLSWAYYYQEDGVEDLKQSLLYSSLELEAAVIADHEEISRKDDEILQLKVLLARIIKERDQFQVKSQELALEKQLLFQQVQALAHSSKHHLDTCPISSGTTSNEDDRNIDMSPSDCDDKINVVVAPSPTGCKDTQPQTNSSAVVSGATGTITFEKPLPEHGKFLRAVMEAGPLLQTLLVADPLPRWQHPPPKLNSVDIPTVTIPSPRILSQDSCLMSPTGGGLTNKRDIVKGDGSDFSPYSKYQKVCSPPIIMDPNNI